MTNQTHETTYAILCDKDFPVDFYGGATQETVGEHDRSDTPHAHWSILTLEANGVVIDVDWGYHSDADARRYLP